MARRPNPVPPYPKKPHKSGQARIYVKGKEVWLGRWGTPASRQKYARVLAEYEVTGLPPAAPAKQGQVTVAQLVNSFRQWAENRYVKNGKQTTEPGLYKLALSPVLDLYGDTAAIDFGPLALIACRSELVARGYCRVQINRHLTRIRRVWKWGISRQIVPQGVWVALTAVEGLAEGEVFDYPDVRPAPMANILAIKGHVLPPVWAMIQLQLWTAMRPGEVAKIRTRDVLREDEAIPLELVGQVWAYRPASHKTEHHGKDRIVFLGPQAQTILEPWLRPDDPDAFLFSPAEAKAYFLAKRLADRKTPGAHKYQRKAKPSRVPSEAYTVHAYAHAITRACEKALGMPDAFRVTKRKADLALSDAEKEKRHALAREWRAKNCWSPNQLRHNAATLIRRKYRAEIARVILGHSNLNTTEIYAEADYEKAAQAMLESG